MANDNENPSGVVVGGIVTGIVGIVGGVLIRTLLPSFDGTDVLRVYQRENNKSAVARHYKDGADSILVQIAPNEFVPVSKYLRTIADAGERATEEVDIKRAVEWYAK